MGFLKEIKKGIKEGSAKGDKLIAERKKREAEEERIYWAALKALWDDKHKNDKR